MELKNDRYKKARGGRSRLLKIACRICGSPICLYQKDGSGALRRMYLDRMNAPAVSLARKSLTCPEGHLLGVKMLYEKEKRPAFRLFVDSVTKKLTKFRPDSKES